LIDLTVGVGVLMRGTGWYRSFTESGVGALWCPEELDEIGEIGETTRGLHVPALSGGIGLISSSCKIEMGERSFFAFRFRSGERRGALNAPSKGET